LLTSCLQLDALFIVCFRILITGSAGWIPLSPFIKKKIHICISLMPFQDCDFGLKLCNQDTPYRTKHLHSVGWSQGNLCGIYDRWSGMGRGYFLRISIFPCQLSCHQYSIWFLLTYHVDTDNVTKRNSS